MKQVEQIICPKWLIKVDGSAEALLEHAVVIDQGRILAVDQKRTLLDQFQAITITELPDHALIPGLVNAHTHAAMTLLRGYADDMPLMNWLQEKIWPAETKWVSEGFVEAGADLAIAEMIRGGTTCFNDMYFFPDVVARRAEKHGMRACVGMIIIDFPTVWAANADEYISKGLQVRDELRHSNLVTTAFAPHAPYTVSDTALKRILTLSDELECQIHMHVHETEFEIEQSTAQFGMRPVERLDQMGMLSSRLSAVHMTQLLPAEIETLANRGVQVVHCPQSNLKLASGFCPVAELSEAGVSISIGTDGAASNNDLDMIEEMRFASLLSKGVSKDPTAMNAYESLEAATLGGAKALGLEETIGSIEKDKSADLTAINLKSLQTQPLFNAISQIVYSSHANHVTDVWIQGRQVLENQSLTTIDTDTLLPDAASWAEKIRGQ